METLIAVLAVLALAAFGRWHDGYCIRRLRRFHKKTIGDD